MSPGRIPTRGIPHATAEIEGSNAWRRPVHRRRGGGASSTGTPLAVVNGGASPNAGCLDPGALIRQARRAAGLTRRELARRRRLRLGADQPHRGGRSSGGGAGQPHGSGCGRASPTPRSGSLLRRSSLDTCGSSHRTARFRSSRCTRSTPPIMTSAARCGSCVGTTTVPRHRLCRRGRSLIDPCCGHLVAPSRVPAIHMGPTRLAGEGAVTCLLSVEARRGSCS
jgi:hypothetical protein